MKEGGRVRLPGGGPVPLDGVKSMKEVVEGLSRSRPGVIPISKVNTLQTGFFQDQDDDYEVFTQVGEMKMSEAQIARQFGEMYRTHGRDLVDRVISEVAQSEYCGEGVNFP